MQQTRAEALLKYLSNDVYNILVAYVVNEKLPKILQLLMNLQQ